MSYVHFKMEALQLFLELITPVCFMASLNLKDETNYRNFREFLQYSRNQILAKNLPVANSRN